MDDPTPWITFTDGSACRRVEVSAPSGDGEVTVRWQIRGEGVAREYVRSQLATWAKWCGRL